MQVLRERRPHRVGKQQQQQQPHQPLKHRFPNNRATTLCLIVQVVLNITFFILLLVTRHNSKSSSPSPPSPTSALPSFYDCFVTIYAYDRPKHLLSLLQDIAREAHAAGITVGVNVIDDNSYACTFPPVSHNIYQQLKTQPKPILNSTYDGDILHQVPLPETLPCAASHRFRYVEKFVHAHGWRIFVSPYRHGRRRYWHLVRHAHQLLKPIQSRFFLFLPDDDRLSTNFFPSVFSEWGSITDSRKLSLMLHVEESREHVAVWTDFKPRPVVNTNVTRIGWVESGNFLCTRALLEFMNWSFPVIPPRRWFDNPPISSGVGAIMSQLIHSSHKRMYRTGLSYVAHVGITSSKMNAAFRNPRIPALRTKYFADGEATYDALLREAATVTASLASHWVREVSLHSAVHSLAHQVDHLNVYLNGYDDVSIPTFLNAPFITVARSQHTALGDLGDVGKFFWANNITSEYHATVDDDIIYPSDYIDKLIRFRQSLKSRTVVGVHGIRVREELLRPAQKGRRGRGYYGSREVWMAIEDVTEAVNVHIIGTGTMLYKVADIERLDLLETFPKPNMADIWFGLLAQRLQMAMVIMPHEKGWIREVEGTFDDSIYKKASARRSAEREQTRAALSIPQWQLFH